MSIEVIEKKLMEKISKLKEKSKSINRRDAELAQAELYRHEIALDIIREIRDGN